MTGQSRVPKPGKVMPPYGGVERCVSASCRRVLSEDTGGAYLFKNRHSGKLCVFCEDCAAYVELNNREQFALVEL